MANENQSNAIFSGTVIAGIMAVSVLGLFTFFSGNANASTIPNSKGAETGQAANPANSAVQGLIEKIKQNSNSAQYLADNITTLQASLTDSISKLQVLFTSDPNLKNHPKKDEALKLLTDMQTQLTAMASNATTNKPAALAAAQTFLKDRDTLTKTVSVVPGKIGNNGVPLIKQTDYPDISYGGGSTVDGAGCGLVSLTMVMSFYHLQTTDTHSFVAKLATFSLSVGGRANASLYPSAAKAFNMHSNEISLSATLALLKQGKPIITHGEGNLPYSGRGHYIVLTGVTGNGEITVNDPAHRPFISTYPVSAITRGNNGYIYLRP